LKYFYESMYQKITIEEFIALSAASVVIDVRSPGEYEHAHFPSAVNIPLFTNEERAVVGTAYKQKGRTDAIKIGLDYYGKRMRPIVEQLETIVTERKKKLKIKSDGLTEIPLLVHCWRGGMRSAAIAWLLDLYGFKVNVLTGGYKSFRQWVLAQFAVPYPLTVLGGYTGSGKTEVLKELEKMKHPVLDLEALANHRGSAFGTVGAQPGQEMFENLVALRLAEIMTQLPTDGKIWVEDESQRIGLVNIPMPFWSQLRAAPIMFLEIPFEERLKYICKTYGTLHKEQLINATIRIQKRLGGLDTKNVVNHLLENNIFGAFEILLRYYDKQYEAGLNKRDNLKNLLHLMSCDNVDHKRNSDSLLLHI
jgi:tRNA 2-selenouridine synthase